MDTKKSIRERRQERIRRIMEHNNSTLPLKQAMQQPQAQAHLVPLSGPAEPQANSPMKTASISSSVQRDLEDDPERLWKANPNPWESAGWRIAPLPSKDVKASKQGGPQAPPPRDFRFIVRGLFIQTAIAGAIFIIVFALFKLDVPAAKQGQQVVTSALTEEMNFDAAAALYKDWFAGAPSFIPLFGDHNGEESELAEGAVDLPIVSPLHSGTVVRTFAETLSGIELAGEPGQEVLAVETGRVLVVSKDDEMGETVVVQHANDRVSVYGHLGLVRVAVNDWIEAGKTIGKLPVAEEGQQSLLYFAVKEKGQYVDPADVVPID
ncbi:M23 family metallopeptidase [Paenibacillus sp. BC26]|uniref:M23 family metallopeptidase n=1 Tax=Paenibacillus sp. BC26 TaxID=1881032 RepID=UPI0008F1B568|nr:M23 family metallopeptidase [Paenibacillus sp. BC26]SFS58447.1 stage IV sporulation protein FA [Paenibacillus sp. BC26]